MQELTFEEFQTFLNKIGYNGEFKALNFKKSAVPELLTILMHIILSGLSGNHGVIDIMSKDWLYVVYNIYSGRSNIVDLTEVLWKDFRKFAIKRMSNEISSSRFYALTLQQLYKERREAIQSIPIQKRYIFLSRPLELIHETSQKYGSKFSFSNHY